MLVTETFHGYIETTQDVLLIFEGCRRGLLPRICRRLQEKERKMVQSGSVFVFDERESGIKRWTDGLVWSPSRILGNFLIYRELDKRASGSGKRGSISAANNNTNGNSNDARQRSFSADHGTSSTVAAAGGVMSIDRNRERQLVGSLSDSYKFRKDGLIKKTMSIVVNGVSQHLISYYHPQDVLNNRLRTPSSVPELASLEISPELLVRQNFRIPPMIEPTFDHPGEVTGAIPMPDGSNGGSGTVAAAAAAAMSAFGDRRTPHPPPLRSMSMGSLRGHDPYTNGNLASPNAMFNYQQRMSIDEEGATTTTNQRESPPTTIGPYGTQPMMYGAAAYTTSAIPSPSSPDTPLVSPARPSFHQQYQRHYSFSSTQSSLSRVDPRGYDMLSYPDRQGDHRSSIHYQQQQQQQQGSMTSMMSADVGFYNGQQNGVSDEHASDHSKGANIGQLLNPVHPLNNTTTATTTSSTITAPHHPPESPHPSHNHEQQQQLLHSMTSSQQQQQPSTSYAGYNPSSLVPAVTTTSSSASSSTSTPSSSIISTHRYDNGKTVTATATNTNERQQQLNGEDENSVSGGGDGGGGGASGFSHGVGYYRDGMLTNTYNAMHYAPPPFQNGLVNPFSSVTGHHQDGNARRMQAAYIDNPPPRYIDQARAFGQHFGGHVRSYFGGMLPIMSWLPQYNVNWFISDLICAITVGTVVVPQSMAYAKIAELPPQYGLYSSFVGVAIYPFLGTSKDVSLGTSAIMSLLVGQIWVSVKSMPEFETGVWTQHQYAVTMALFAGIVTLGLSILRLGILFDFICEPAIAGFMAGSGLTIVINQFSKIFGVPDINTSEAPYLVFGKTLIHLNESRVDAAFGILSLVWLYGIRYLSQYLTRRYPQYARVIFYFNISRSVVLIVFTTFLSWLIIHFGYGDADDTPFAILGSVPSGFQMMGVPKVDRSLLATVATNIPSVVTLLIMEHCAIATILGKSSDYRINVNQEIMANGLANIFGSFFSSYPVTGSFSRSAVSSKSGAKTPMLNVVVAIIVVLALYVFTPAFQYIITASLAAVIIHAVTDLIVGPSVWYKYWRLHPSELIIFAAAYIISLFTRLDISVYVPVALSLIVQLYRSARPSYAIMGQLIPPLSSSTRATTQEAFYCSFSHPTMGKHVQPIGQGILCFQPHDNLVFENAKYVFGKLLELVEDHNEILKALILDLSSVHQMDYTAMEELKSVAIAALRHSNSQHVRWYFVVNDSLAVRKCLLVAGFGTQRPKRGGLFHSDWSDRSGSKLVLQHHQDDEKEQPLSNNERRESKHNGQVVMMECYGAAAAEAPSLDDSVGMDTTSTGHFQGKYVSPEDQVDWDTIQCIRDVYPYFFPSLQAAATAAIEAHLPDDILDVPPPPSSSSSTDTNAVATRSDNDMTRAV
ncbi:hypothetical protein K492DRAFT_203964 [Lichtheimia hyalospora FSU 10163]|nr:hypothetical protein K492DRAFT_203964 [Lichtheimia hyalospora FSU 10163]